MKKLAKFFAVAITGFSVCATAQTDYPTKIVQVLVGYPPGGNTDSIARTLAHEAQKILRRDVIVVNKAGAAGAIAVMHVAASEPDGHTLMVTTSSTLTTTPFVQDVPSDLLERTTPLVWLGSPQQGMAVRSESPIRSVKDLIEEARRNPGKVSVGSQGIGSGPSMVVQAIALDENVKISVIPFKGDAPAVTDLLGGHITAVGTSAFSFGRNVAAGKLRTIASMDGERLQNAPDVPTLIEQGYPYKVQTIFYLLGPRALPAGVAKRIVDVFSEASQTASYRNATEVNGIVTSNPIASGALERYLLDDRAKIGEMVKRLGIKKG